MDKAATLKIALKSKKATGGKAQKVQVVNKPEVTIASEEPKRMPPVLRLNSQDLPAIKGWKVGSTYKLELTVKMTSLRQGSEYDMIDQSPDKDTSASFKVTLVRTA